MLIWSGRREEGHARKQSGLERLRYLRDLRGHTADDSVNRPTLWTLLLCFLLPGYGCLDRTLAGREIVAAEPEDIY